MTYVIEKNIPLPPLVRGYVTTLPFAEMEIGDSFVVPFENNEAKVTHKVRAAVAHRSHKPLGRKYTCRVVPLADGMRVWRVK